MGRVGSTLDNTAAESFNSTLEWELLPRRDFATKDQARQEIAGYIDRYMVVQERLGHSSISITLDRYSHVVEGMDREAAEIVARMIKGSG